MKKIILLLLVIIVQSLFAQLSIQNPQYMQTVYAFDFVDENTGWISDAAGMMKTTDGGRSFERVNDLIAGKIKFFNRNIGWILYGDYYLTKSLYKTEDGGFTWDKKIEIDKVYDIAIISADTVYATGKTKDYPALIKTFDGGENWEILKDTTDKGQFGKIQFISSEYGWVHKKLNDTYFLMNTTDGGKTWLQQYGNQGDFDFDFISKSKGWLKQENDLFVSKNSGWAWDTLHYFDGGDRLSNKVEFINDSTGFVYGDMLYGGDLCPARDCGALFKTDDGGMTWYTILFNSSEMYDNATVKEFIMLNDSIGYLRTGDLFKTNDGGESWKEVGVVTEKKLSSVYFITDNVGWVCGEEGEILKTTNRGKGWVRQDSVVSETLSSVHFVDENIGWIVGTKGTVLYTTNSGQAWIKKEINTTNDLTSIFWLDSNLGWITGSSGAFYNSTDGGNTWKTVDVGTKDGLKKVKFLDKDLGFISSNGGLYKTIDGGINWSRITSGGINDFDFYNKDYGVYIAGMSVYYTTDGGKNWVQKYSLNTHAFPTFKNVHMFDENRILFIKQNDNAGHYNATLEKSTDGGNSFSSVAYVDGNWECFYFRSFYLGWILGGNVYQYEYYYIYKYDVQQQLENTDIDPIELYLPAQNMKNDSNRVSFKWNYDEKAQHYKLSISKDQKFANTIIDTLISTNYFETYLYDLGTYYWKVVGFNKVDTVSSETSSFELYQFFNLSQNYPNPFNSTTSIDYAVESNTSGRVKLVLYNILGQKVKVLVDEIQEPGPYQIKFDAKNLSSGVYFYRLRIDELTETKKMLLLK